MIPLKVENRIASYFFHRYLPEEVMIKIVYRLLTPSIWSEEEALDFDELFSLAIEILV